MTSTAPRKLLLYLTEPLLRAPRPTWRGPLRWKLRLLAAIPTGILCGVLADLALRRKRTRIDR